eukprot:4058252-Prymnesium_polylepis.3
MCVCAAKYTRFPRPNANLQNGQPEHSHAFFSWCSLHFRHPLRHAASGCPGDEIMVDARLMARCLEQASHGLGSQLPGRVHALTRKSARPLANAAVQGLAPCWGRHARQSAHTAPRDRAAIGRGCNVCAVSRPRWHAGAARSLLWREHVEKNLPSHTRKRHDGIGCVLKPGCNCAVFDDHHFLPETKLARPPTGCSYADSRALGPGAHRVSSASCRFLRGGLPTHAQLRGEAR